MKTVAVSGGFDPVHPGHLRMIEKARSLAGPDGAVIVILNNDNWLRAKKGFCFMNEKERAEVLSAIKGVSAVFTTLHEENPQDMSVARPLEILHPDIFLNGGDRTDKNTPEMDVCKQLGIEMVFNATSDKPYDSHSSVLMKNAAPHVGYKKTPWGHMETYRNEKDWWVKSLTIEPGQRISLQRHFQRGESWTCVEGKFDTEIGETRANFPLEIGHTITIQKGVLHRISNKTDKPATLIEVAIGPAFEEDIERFEDDYGRS